MEANAWNVQGSSVVKPRQLALLVLAGVVMAAAAASVFFQRYLAEPRHPFLVSGGGARWIRFDEPVELRTRPVEDVAAGFRARFRVPEGFGGAALTLKAMKAANVFIDDQLVFSTGADRQQWLQPRRVELPPSLAPGDHEMKVVVVNDTGPSCLLAYCTELALATGHGWESSIDARNWTQAAAVDDYRPSDLSRAFVRADRALLRSLPLLAAVFAAVFGWSLARESEWRVSPLARRVTPRPSTYRWLLLAAVGAMAANNIFKVPFYLGFDCKGHVQYIEYIVQHRSIPLPTQGWTMFQAPLYYLISAPVYAAAAALFEPERAAQALRVVTLACGLAQVELAYRAARYVFPKRDGVQMVATTVGGLLPASLYMSQYIGNESLAGVTTGLVLVLALRFLYEPERGRNLWSLGLMGFVLGLALLSKLTAMFLLPPLAALMACAYSSDPGGKRLRKAATAFALVFLTAAVVGGWYYARNYITLGRAFWGGWEPERGINWWQDPGYRTLWQLVPAGEALVWPVCSSLVSFWDGFYSTLWADGYVASTTDPNYVPPWNYNLMLGGVLLALIPAGMIVAGAGSALKRRPERAGLVFLGGALAVFVAMMLYGFLSLPYYCVIKGSYTLGLASAYGSLAAAGFALLAREKFTRAALSGLLAAWAAAAYGAYFILS